MTVFERRLTELGFASYESYLRSDHWSAFKRKYRISGALALCAVCGSAKIQLHHHNYANLGNESVSDVTPLCDQHHSEVHAWLEKTGGMVNATHKAVEALVASLSPPTGGPTGRNPTKREIERRRKKTVPHDKAKAAGQSRAAYSVSHEAQMRRFLTQPRR